MGSESPLRSFLAGASGAGLPSFDEVRGFILAVAGTPELVPPSQWLPETFNGQLPEFDDGAQAQAILGEVMDLYNTALSGERGMKSLAPEFRKDILANLDEHADAARWVQGFLRGYSWLEDVWNEVRQDELDDELGSVLLILSFFASRRMAEAFRDEMGGGKPLDELARSMRRMFSDAMAEYVQLGQSIYQARLQVERPVSREQVEIGRNEPCPCGSGRKYKHCCQQ